MEEEQWFLEHGPRGAAGNVNLKSIQSKRSASVKSIMDQNRSHHVRVPQIVNRTPAITVKFKIALL